VAVVGDEGALRELIGSPTELVQQKIADRLNELTRQFVERSPFVCVATASPGGGLDVSPRGDPAGFVRILDERTLLLPERPGNKLADTFRINGTATIVDDPELLAPCAVDGKTPKLGILVTVAEAYTQCSKALIRSDLWNPEKHIERSELPSSGEILRAVGNAELDAERYDRERAERYARGDGLY